MLRARHINLAVDPGRRGKGLGTVHARLTTERFWKGNPLKNQAKWKVWKPQFLAPIRGLNYNTFRMIFQKHISRWELKSQLLNWTLNFQTHSNIGDNFLLHTYSINRCINDLYTKALSFFSGLAHHFLVIF